MLMQMTTIKYRCGHVLRILMPAGSAAQETKVAAVSLCLTCRRNAPRQTEQRQTKKERTLIYDSKHRDTPATQAELF